MGVSDLHDFLEDRAGTLYRATVRYDGDSTDVLYLRDDVREDRMRSEIDRMLRRLRPESKSKETRSFPFGQLHATVRSFEEAVVMHFPIGRDRGIVVSLEPEAAKNLNTFIRRCQKRLHG